MTTTETTADRGAALDDAHAGYMEAWHAASDDLRAAQREAWNAYQARLDGLAAEYLQTVDRIRAGELLP